MEEIKECFGPLLVVERDEVQFAHESARNFFSHEGASPENSRPWYILDASEISHRNIVDICLRYLVLPDVHKQMLAACMASPNTEPIFEGQPDLLSYVIQFWPHHYQLGYGVNVDVPATKNISSFLRDRKVLQLRAAANWYFSNSQIRSDRSFLSPLPIIASLGLEQLVSDLINDKELCEDSIAAMTLVEAARHGHGAVVQVILRSSSIDRSGNLQAMTAAARSAHFNILKDLFEYARTNFPDLPLPNILISRAAFFGADDILEFLIKGGAKINLPVQPEHSPPLHCAIAGNNISTVEVLLRHGASPTLPNTNWNHAPPVVVAAKYGHAAILKMLVEAGASVEDKDSEKNPALWWAVQHAHHEAVKTLIEAGADKNSVDLSVPGDVDLPVFFFAASESFLKCVRALLLYRVDPSVPGSKTTDSKYALSKAAKAGDADMCRLLIEFGANADGSDDDKPLIHAVMSKKREVVELLLEKGAGVDGMVGTDTFLNTPLIAAVELEDLEMAKFLVEKSASVDRAVTETQATAVTMAAREGLTDMVKRFIGAGADINRLAWKKEWNLLHTAFSHPETLKVLLDAGIDIDLTTKDGTVLYLAAYNNRPELVRLLLSRGAKTEIRCREQNHWDDNFTPLHAAAGYGYTTVVRALVESGADIRRRLQRVQPH
jgi:ankyrin repeat protein